VEEEIEGAGAAAPKAGPAPGGADGGGRLTGTLAPALPWGRRSPRCWGLNRERGGGARWNDETQSWETEDRRGYTRAPAAALGTAVVPVVPVVPWCRAAAPLPRRVRPVARAAGTYNNITGTFEPAGQRCGRREVLPGAGHPADRRGRRGRTRVGAATLWFTLGGDNAAVTKVRGGERHLHELETPPGNDGRETPAGQTVPLRRLRVGNRPGIRLASGGLPPHTRIRTTVRLPIAVPGVGRTHKDRGAVFYKSPTEWN